MMEINKLQLQVTIRLSRSIKWFSLVWLLGFYLVKTHDFFFLPTPSHKKRVEWQKFYNFWSPVASVLKLLPLSQTAWLNTYSSVCGEINSEGALLLTWPPTFLMILAYAQLLAAPWACNFCLCWCLGVNHLNFLIKNLTFWSCQFVG